MSAVGLQIIANMNLEEGKLKKWVVGAAKYGALSAGVMPHNHNTNDIVEEKFSIFHLEPLPPSIEKFEPKLHRCMVCRKRLERQDIFMSRGVAFCSVECRSSDAAGDAKVDPSIMESRRSPSRTKAPYAPTWKSLQHGSSSTSAMR